MKSCMVSLTSKSADSGDQDGLEQNLSNKLIYSWKCILPGTRTHTHTQVLPVDTQEPSILPYRYRSELVTLAAHAIALSLWILSPAATSSFPASASFLNQMSIMHVDGNEIPLKQEWKSEGRKEASYWGDCYFQIFRDMHHVWHALWAFSKSTMSH